MLRMRSEGAMEPEDPLRSKVQVLVRKVLASSSVYYLVLMWLIRVVVFVLWIGKGILLWFLTVSFSLIRECTQRYLSVALLGFAITPKREAKSSGDEMKRMEEEEFVECVGGDEEVDVMTSPLLPIVLRDRVQICEENLGLEDR